MLYLFQEFRIIHSQVDQIDPFRPIVARSSVFYLPLFYASNLFSSCLMISFRPRSWLCSTAFRLGLSPRFPGRRLLLVSWRFRGEGGVGFSSGRVAARFQKFQSRHSVLQAYQGHSFVILLWFDWNQRQEDLFDSWRRSTRM
jgi:hypothetical protein